MEKMPKNESKTKKKEMKEKKMNLRRKKKISPYCLTHRYFTINKR